MVYPLSSQRLVARRLEREVGVDILPCIAVGHQIGLSPTAQFLRWAAWGGSVGTAEKAVYSDSAINTLGR